MTRDMTQEHVLPGLRVLLSKPWQVIEGVNHCWFPGLALTKTGELIMRYLLVADVSENLVDASGLSVSYDGGKTWPFAYDLGGFCGGSTPRISLPDGSVVGPGWYYAPDPPGQYRRFTGAYERFEDGGERYIQEPRGSHIEGFPRDVSLFSQGIKWNRRQIIIFLFFGHAIEVDGELLTTAYLVYQGDDRYTAVVLKSNDQGRTWRYFSQIAGPDDVPDSPEGPDEGSLVQLADGDLMCVMRVGFNRGEPLARCYSSDGGKTWSKVDRLPAYSVAPRLHRLQNGVIVLATGRPGLFLWLSNDPRGESWHPVDLLAHHNATLDQPHHIFPGEGYPGAGAFDSAKHGDQTTAYMDLLEISPNRLLLAYDRVPNGWNPVPPDSDERNRIYLLNIDVERM